MSVSWEVASATQITRYGAATTGTVATQVAGHIGGSACVIHSSCCPVGGRPASPRKSQTKSQRRPTSGDTQRRQATDGPGQVPTERHEATSSDARNVTGGQGVAGSNPAVPTGFSNTCTPKWERNCHDHSHLTGQDEQTIQTDGQAIPITRAAMAEIPARRAG